MARYFRTHTGRRVHPLAPCPDEIDIFDIARSLCHLCRFLGHALDFYSVAQHSVHVSELVPPEDALWGLLHDAGEAYLCDLPSPLKRSPEMAVYRDAENRLMEAVCKRYGLRPEMPESVRVADRVLLATEFRDVTSVSDLAWIRQECGVEPMAHFHVFPWPSRIAEKIFLARFQELTR